VTEQLEHDLRRLFAEDAEKAPTSVPVIDRTPRRAGLGWNSPLAWGAGALVAASVAGLALLGGGWPSSESPVAAPTAAPPSFAAPATPSGQTGGAGASEESAGALPGPANSACRVYSTDFLSTLEVAFDGTVTAIEPARPSRIGPTWVIPATFAINEWYRGGSAESITVGIPLPRDEANGPPFDVGTRLLVSGNTPGDAPADSTWRAWGCGYTRYYDQPTADSWRAAFD
jgi:hypothetical protein